VEPSTAVKQTVLRFYEALTTGNASAIQDLMSRQEGVLAIGTDPQEWWGGYDTITSVFKSQLEEMGGGFPIESGSLQAFSEGSVGWAADQPVLKQPDGSELSFRLTAVLRQEQDVWKIVQWHVSFGVANEDVLGKELTV
jgi:ketosteroid isomerase-like protein